MPLTDLKIRSLKPAAKPYKAADGGGLYIQVTPTGSKLWRMRYRFDGKQQLLSFGAYPDVGLARARERRQEARSLLAEGVNPSAKKKADKAAAAALTEHTFARIAQELLEKNRKEGKAGTTLKKKAWLLDFAIADFGDEPITSITAPLVLKTLRKVEAKGNYETAKRLRAVTGEVFRYAIATARTESDPTYGLRGALIAPQVKHMAAITTRDEFANLVRAIWAYEGGGPTIRAALKLMVLLYPRPGELRLAHWAEFDLGNGTWTIPEDRMKMRRQGGHVKPLPAMAIDILRELEFFVGNDGYVFPSLYARGKPISENTLNQALRRMGFSSDEATSHGFRSSASSLLNESGRWNPDAIEAELAHAGADQVRRAYHRATYWDERIDMAAWWADEVGSMLERSE